MQPIQERDANNNVLVTYTRGLDLSGSLQGAGGIGGLLARTDGNGSAFYHADGSGNITALMDGYENMVARYLYHPFGKQIGQWGALAGANVMRFSSMPVHPLSGMPHFPLRDLGDGRWLSRDPIGEAGGINLYGFVKNNPIYKIDPLGLDYHAVAAPWGGGNDYPYYYGDTMTEDASAFLYNWGAGIMNTIEGVGAFTEWAANKLTGGNGEVALLYIGMNCPRIPAFPKTEGVIAGGRIEKGGLFQLRYAGQEPLFRLDYHKFEGVNSPPLLHIDSPPLGAHHWPWQMQNVPTSAWVPIP